MIEILERGRRERGGWVGERERERERDSFCFRLMSSDAKSERERGREHCDLCLPRRGHIFEAIKDGV